MHRYNTLVLILEWQTVCLSCLLLLCRYLTSQFVLCMIHLGIDRLNYIPTPPHLINSSIIHSSDTWTTNCLSLLASPSLSILNSTKIVRQWVIKVLAGSIMYQHVSFDQFKAENTSSDTWPRNCVTLFPPHFLSILDFTKIVGHWIVKVFAGSNMYQPLWFYKFIGIIHK